MLWLLAGSAQNTDLGGLGSKLWSWLFTHFCVWAHVATHSPSVLDAPWRNVRARWAQVFQEERGLVVARPPSSQAVVPRGREGCAFCAHTRVHECAHVSCLCVWMKTRKCASLVGWGCEGHKSTWGQWVKNVAGLIFWWPPNYEKNKKTKSLLFSGLLIRPPTRVDTNFSGSRLRSRLQFTFKNGLISQFLQDQYFPACVFFLGGWCYRKRSGWLFSGENGIC